MIMVCESLSHSCYRHGCHIVNTASMAGLISGPGLGAYKVTKHGVVTLSETLYQELAERGAKVKVSVLCPGIVNTRLMESARNRPGHLPTREALGPASEARWEGLRHLVPAGMPPAQVADAVFEALRKDQFYILTHPEGKAAVRTRMEDILQECNPAGLQRGVDRGLSGRESSTPASSFLQRVPSSYS